MMMTPPPGIDPIQRMGWSVIAMGARPWRHSVELTEAITWTAARVWTMPGSLRSVPLDNGTTRIIIGVDERAEMTVDGEPLTLRPRDLILIDGASEVTVDNTRPWARYELLLRSPVLRHGTGSGQVGKTQRLGEDESAVLAALLNEVSTRSGLAARAGAELLAHAIAEVVMFSLHNALDLPPALSPSESRLFQEALRLIQENYLDPRFSVGDLAARMSVSRNHIHRIFARTGRTPRTEIEARRVRAARSALERSPARGKDTLQQIALASGFPSSRRLREALNREDGRR